MTQQEQRKVENYVLSTPLRDVEDVDMLACLASLIQDHDHLREVLMTETDPRIRRGKLDAMRANLHFTARPCEEYELAALAIGCGHQPIYEVIQ